MRRYYFLLIDCGWWMVASLCAVILPQVLHVPGLWAYPLGWCCSILTATIIKRTIRYSPDDVISRRISLSFFTVSFFVAHAIAFTTRNNAIALGSYALGWGISLIAVLCAISITSKN
jgi:hypothetical protein